MSHQTSIDLDIQTKTALSLEPKTTDYSPMKFKVKAQIFGKGKNSLGNSTRNHSLLHSQDQNDAKNTRPNTGLSRNDSRILKMAQSHNGNISDSYNSFSVYNPKKTQIGFMK